MSTTLRLLAAAGNTDYSVGFAFGRLLVIGAVVWAIAHYVRNARRPPTQPLMPPQHPHQSWTPPHYPQHGWGPPPAPAPHHPPFGQAPYGSPAPTPAHWASPAHPPTAPPPAHEWPSRAEGYDGGGAGRR
ncbi:MAG: hypothetical protein AB1925_18675 [Actinomycetota bacterium]